jgi:hypothetical protein
MKPRRKGHLSSSGSRRHSVAAAATETRLGVPPAAFLLTLPPPRFASSLPLPGANQLTCAPPPTHSDQTQPAVFDTDWNPIAHLI